MEDDSPPRTQHISNTCATHSGQTFAGINNGNIFYANSDNSVHKCKPFQNIPFPPDRDFVDRPEILAWIHRMCMGPGARAALVGLGGVGKSQLAIQYAYSILNAEPSPFVFWVHASTKQRFEQSYRALAKRLKLPGLEDPKADVLGLVRTWLCDGENGQWMMIIDNADDVETFFLSPDEPIEDTSASLAAYLPQSCNGSILITSRNRTAAARLAGGHNYIKEVPTMDESQCLQLLRNKLLPRKLQDTSSEEDAMNLLHTLGYVPLAIAQAAAYINQGFRMTIAGYLAQFRANDKKKESLLHHDTGDLRRDSSASNSVVSTWQMSFERIRRERPSAADLLSLMSFFNPQSIPVWILEEFRRDVEGSDCEDKANFMLNEDLDTLYAYSLVAATAEPNTCEMHALVQFCTQVWLSSSGGLEQWKREFVELMAREFPHGHFENWTRCQQLLPHAEWLLNSELVADELLEASTRVLRMVAWYMQMRGNYKMAERTVRKVIIARESVAGLGNVETLDSLNDLAAVLQDRGQYSEAEVLHRRALKGREEELGVRHPNTLVSVNNLAIVLQDRGLYSEAEELHLRALKGREEKLGVWHPNTLQSLNNLAVVLRDQRRYSEAEKLHRQVLKGRAKELGVRHPNTLQSVNNLAVVLRDQGKFYGDTEELCRWALKGREEELGVRHPETLQSLYSLAYLLHQQKQYEEAGKLYQRAYDGLRQELGYQHPTTKICLKNFSAMQEEEKQAGLEQNKELVRNEFRHTGEEM